MPNIYQKQVELLLQCLPSLAYTDVFALKGGTAINLFLRQDFPRLSVDLDLTYLPIEDRNTTLMGIEEALIAMQNRIKKNIKNCSVLMHKNNTTKTITKFSVEKNGTLVKIEPNLILRGVIYPIANMDLAEQISSTYKVDVVDIPVVSKAEIYGGKICAALDRQHPRDLFDIMLLLQEEITKEIKAAFLVYLISHNRPMHELLQPNRLEQQLAFQNEFIGMTNIPVSYTDLVQAREQLISTVNSMLNKQDKEFLLSVKQGEPNWEYLGLSNVERLPAVQWKLMNIKKMEKTKYEKAVINLKKVLYNS